MESPYRSGLFAWLDRVQAWSKRGPLSPVIKKPVFCLIVLGTWLTITAPLFLVALLAHWFGRGRPIERVTRNAYNRVTGDHWG